MSSIITSFTDIIARWGSVSDFAGDIGVDPKHAHGMRRRRSIPPYYWTHVVNGAAKRGYREITHELLIKLGGKQPGLRLRRPAHQRVATRRRS